MTERFIGILIPGSKLFRNIKKEVEFEGAEAVELEAPQTKTRLCFQLGKEMHQGNLLVSSKGYSLPAF